MLDLDAINSRRGEMSDMETAVLPIEDLDALIAEVKRLREIFVRAADEIDSHELADGPLGCHVWLSHKSLGGILGVSELRLGESKCTQPNNT